MAKLLSNLIEGVVSCRRNGIRGVGHTWEATERELARVRQWSRLSLSPSRDRQSWMPGWSHER